MHTMLAGYHPHRIQSLSPHHYHHHPTTPIRDVAFPQARNTMSIRHLHLLLLLPLHPHRPLRRNNIVRNLHRRIPPTMQQHNPHNLQSNNNTLRNLFQNRREALGNLANPEMSATQAPTVPAACVTKYATASDRVLHAMCLAKTPTIATMFVPRLRVSAWDPPSLALSPRPQSWLPAVLQAIRPNWATTPTTLPTRITNGKGIGVPFRQIHRPTPSDNNPAV